MYTVGKYYQCKVKKRIKRREPGRVTKIKRGIKDMKIHLWDKFWCCVS